MNIFGVHGFVRFTVSKVLFPKRSAKMIDSSEKCRVSWLLNLGIQEVLKSEVTCKYINC